MHGGLVDTGHDRRLSLAIDDLAPSARDRIHAELDCRLSGSPGLRWERPRVSREMNIRRFARLLILLSLFVVLMPQLALHSQSPPKRLISSVQPAGDSPIRFVFQPIDFKLDSDETPERHAPETMAGGVAIFDYNNDGKLDIFFTNGA